MGGQFQIDFVSPWRLITSGNPFYDPVLEKLFWYCKSLFQFNSRIFQSSFETFYVRLFWIYILFCFMFFFSTLLKGIWEYNYVLSFVIVMPSTTETQSIPQYAYFGCTFSLTFYRNFKTLTVKEFMFLFISFHQSMKNIVHKYLITIKLHFY